MFDEVDDRVGRGHVVEYTAGGGCGPEAAAVFGPDQVGCELASFDRVPLTEGIGSATAAYAGADRALDIVEIRIGGRHVIEKVAGKLVDIAVQVDQIDLSCLVFTEGRDEQAGVRPFVACPGASRVLGCEPDSAAAKITEYLGAEQIRRPIAAVAVTPGDRVVVAAAAAVTAAGIQVTIRSKMQAAAVVIRARLGNGQEYGSSAASHVRVPTGNGLAGEGGIAAAVGVLFDLEFDGEVCPANIGRWPRIPVCWVVDTNLDPILIVAAVAEESK